MRIQHVAQAAKSWPDATPGDRAEAARLADTIEHIRWRLWHGQVQRALDLIGDTRVILDAAAETASPHAATAGKVAGVLRGLETYVSGQGGSGEPISTATTESTVQPLWCMNRTVAASAHWVEHHWIRAEAGMPRFVI